MGSCHTHLDFKNRCSILKLLNEGKNQSEIASLLNVHKSTISRELKRLKEDATQMNRLNYDPVEAHCHANRSKEKSKKERILSKDKDFWVEIKNYITVNLWSPEQISGHLKLIAETNGQGKTISHETIYQYIYSIKDIEEKRLIIDALRQKKKYRRRKNSKDKRGKIPNRTSIHDRPKVAYNRTVSGHWEGDIVVGKDHKSGIGTLVDRATRYTIIVKLYSLKSEHVVKQFAKRINELPDHLKLSLTYDNGHEMSSHELFSKLTGMKVYFADPGSPHQRPSNENTNGLLRGNYYPKKTNFNTVSEDHILQTEKSLNTRPRKVLSYRTPFELLERAKKMKE